MEIKRLNFSDKNFESALKKRLAFDTLNNKQVIEVTNDILEKIKDFGDKALIDFTNKFDLLNIKISSDLEISQKDINLAFENIDSKQKRALEEASSRVFDYHKKQKIESWSYKDTNGSLFGQKVTPLDKVGLYVPGGKASYPSSVLMNAIPAKVAGVEELIMVVPTPDNEKNDLVLAAAKIAGVDRIFAIGGAQAIAAMAYGTKIVNKVDKIVGPGNAYVAGAKKQVFGDVGIDMVAGPSEVTIVADKWSKPDWIAADLIAQAEHDENAQSIVISDDVKLINKINYYLYKQLKVLPKKK